MDSHDILHDFVLEFGTLGQLQDGFTQQLSNGGA